jgi:ribosomal protein L16/L10AE
MRVKVCIKELPKYKLRKKLTYCNNTREQIRSLNLAELTLKPKVTYTLVLNESGRLSEKHIVLLNKLSAKISKARRRDKVKRFNLMKFLLVPVTGKSAGMRMGGGKGNVRKFFCPVRKGDKLLVLFKMARKTAFGLFHQIQHRLPLSTSIAFD